MTSKVKPAPEGHNSVSPYLMIRGAASAIEFYEKALGATELMRVADKRMYRNKTERRESGWSAVNDPPGGSFGSSGG